MNILRKIIYKNIKHAAGGKMMSDMDIFNIHEKLKEITNDINKEDLHTLGQELELENFKDVLLKSGQIREKYQSNAELQKILLLVEAVSYAQTGDLEASAEIISELYNSMPLATDEIVLLGQLAFMCDYKLRSEEHTSELQSRGHLVCRLLLEKKK